MPKYLTARPPLDAIEERQVCKLAHSHHAPADWIIHAQMVAHSWDGVRTRQIAAELDCHPQTVIRRRCEIGSMPSTSAGSMGWG